MSGNTSETREYCKNCFLRIYLEGHTWRHHANNSVICFGALKTRAEPPPEAVPEQPNRAHFSLSPVEAHETVAGKENLTMKNFVIAFHVCCETKEQAHQWRMSALQILDQNTHALGYKPDETGDLNCHCSGHADEENGEEEIPLIPAPVVSTAAPEPDEPQWFQKKPVKIRALQWTGNNEDEMGRFMPGKFTISDSGARLFIATLEGTMEAQVLDWIICGVKGEFYPCKPEIFEASYTPVAPESYKPAQQPCSECATPSWLCFHCGFKTSDRFKAEAHFGDGEGDSAICLYWSKLSTEERLSEFQDMVQQLNLERDDNGELVARAEKAEAECATLRKGLEDETRNANEMTKTALRLHREVVAATAQLSTLRDALKKYGHHAFTCKTRSIKIAADRLKPIDESKCNCGLTAALAPTPEVAPKEGK